MQRAEWKQFISYDQFTGPLVITARDYNTQPVLVLGPICFVEVLLCLPRRGAEAFLPA